MPYTFSGTTGLITIGLPYDAFNAGRNVLITQWVYPTTLTATRRLWSSGTLWGAAIAATTSSIQLSSDHATTDGVWTFPAGLAVNTWTYVAILCCQSGSTAVSWTAWTGTLDGQPIQQRTVTQVTAPVGAIAAGNSALNIGNTSGATLAFLGDIGPTSAYFDGGQSQALNTLGPVDGSALSADAVDRVLQNFVIPLFQGDAAYAFHPGRLQTAIDRRGPMFLTNMDGLAAAPMFYRPSSQPEQVAGTASGTVATSTAPSPRLWTPLGGIW